MEFVHFNANTKKNFEREDIFFDISQIQSDDPAVNVLMHADIKK